jgi:hypothetical protein
VTAGNNDGQAVVLSGQDAAFIRHALTAASASRRCRTQHSTSPAAGPWPGALRRLPRGRSPRLPHASQEHPVTAAAPAPPPLDDGLDQLLRRMRLPHMRRVAPRSSPRPRPGGGIPPRSCGPC